MTRLYLPQGQQQQNLIKKLHIKKGKNSLFYCTTTEIVYGTIHQQNWGPVLQEMTQKNQMITAIMAAEALPRFLNSKFGHALVIAIKNREAGGNRQPLKTAACGLDKNSESFWLDMFRVMSETGTNTTCLFI